MTKGLVDKKVKKLERDIPGIVKANISDKLVMGVKSGGDAIKVDNSKDPPPAESK